MNTIALINLVIKKILNVTTATLYMRKMYSYHIRCKQQESVQ